MSILPGCSRVDCAINKLDASGKPVCVALKEAVDTAHCSFFKTREQARKDRKAARLHNIQHGVAMPDIEDSEIML